MDNTVTQVTITYSANGGTGTVPASQTTYSGSGVTLASGSGLTRSGYTFGGWNANSTGTGASYTAGDYYSFTADITLYAKWTDNAGTESVQTPSNLSLAESLTWISNNAVEGGAYTITLNADESIAPQTLYYNGKKVSITLDGGSAERTVGLSSTGALFTINNGVTLTLGNNVTLQGRSDNTTSLVQVGSSDGSGNISALVMNDGSKITGNASSSYSYGGGVYVNYYGTFTMSGGAISSNTSPSHGGGVYSGGTFTMSGGEISGNTAASDSD
jgi:uncharacterized repeat protein (TIGR02543 family)